MRLALGYGAFALAAACFLWDYRFGFDSTKPYTAVAVGLYTILNGALTYWISRVERGAVYQGTAPSGEKVALSSPSAAPRSVGPLPHALTPRRPLQLTIATATKKNDPTYRLTFSVEAKGAEARVTNFSKPFASFFDETGRFVARPFQEALASSIPIVGRQDPKRVKLASQAMVDADPHLLDAVLAANAADERGSSTAAEPAGGKGGKRRKA